jgi:predicted O-methyltransferase YrrM
LIFKQGDKLADTEIIDGATFELRPHHFTPTKKKWICLRKSREITNRYLVLAEEFRKCRMVEVGVNWGGSTSFFAKLLKPHKMIALELSSKPVKTIMDFLAEQDPEGRVEIHWGVNQSDRVVVPDIIDRTFGKQSLDLVVDDASHLLAPSTATFEMLFPRLRPGGLFVLEDWSGDHDMERGVINALAKEKDVEGHLSGQFQAAAQAATQAATTMHPEQRSPMSVLICQLVIAAGRNPDWISEVRIEDGFCEVRRGEAEIPTSTPIATYTGHLGTWLFEQHTD